MLKSKIKLILLVVSLGFVLTSALHPVTVQARGLVPCGGYNDDGTREHPCTLADAFYMTARVTNWLVGVAGIYAVYQIVNAGFWLTVSAGNEEAITSRKKSLSNAVVGFFIVMAAYMFMNTAVNLLLAQSMPGKTVNFQDPLCYITNGQQCLKKQ